MRMILFHVLLLSIEAETQSKNKTEFFESYDKSEDWFKPSNKSFSEIPDKVPLEEPSETGERNFLRRAKYNGHYVSQFNG